MMSVRREKGATSSKKKKWGGLNFTHKTNIQWKETARKKRKNARRERSKPREGSNKFVMRERQSESGAKGKRGRALGTEREGLRARKEGR